MRHRKSSINQELLKSIRIKTERRTPVALGVDWGEMDEFSSELFEQFDNKYSDNLVRGQSSQGPAGTGSREKPRRASSFSIGVKKQVSEDPQGAQQSQDKTYQTIVELVFMKGEKSLVQVFLLNFLGLLYGVIKMLIPFFAEKMSDNLTYNEFIADATEFSVLMILQASLKQGRRLLLQMLTENFENQVKKKILLQASEEKEIRELFAEGFSVIDHSKYTYDIVWKYAEKLQYLGYLYIIVEESLVISLVLLALILLYHRFYRKNKQSVRGLEGQLQLSRANADEFIEINRADLIRGNQNSTSREKVAYMAELIDRQSQLKNSKSAREIIVEMIQDCEESIVILVMIVIALLIHEIKEESLTKIITYTCCLRELYHFIQHHYTDKSEESEKRDRRAKKDSSGFSP